MGGVPAIGPVASHGSWIEHFPWTRLLGVAFPASFAVTITFAVVVMNLLGVGILVLARRRVAGHGGPVTHD